MKKLIAVLTAVSLTAALVSGCGESVSEKNTPAETTEKTEAKTAAEEKVKDTEKKEKEVVEFWYGSANEESTAMFERLFEEYNASHDDYEFKYVGIANKDSQDKLAMAIATNTMPDVFSTGFNSIIQYATQDAILPIDDFFSTWEDSDKFAPNVVEALRTIGNGTLYAFPYAYNQDISWYNQTLLDGEGITPPVTQKEFLELCEKYANPEKGTYFFSLRGSLPYDNLLAWLFTYTDGAGYDGSYFDENNSCILNKPEFVEALDAYANIYKNHWVSGDCVNNGFNEMVAEFGAGTAMYIMHNSSSKPRHTDNLGEGNFGVTKSLANDEGRYYNSALQSLLFAVANKHDDNADYTGAFELCKFLTSEKVLSEFCSMMGNVPVNMECYEADWFKNDPFMPLYQEIVQDEKHMSIQNPYWLPEYSSFIQNEMTTDFQGVLMGDMSSKEALDHWAETLTGYQKEYLETK